MPKWTIDLQIKKKGTLFTQDVTPIIRRFLREAEEAMAREGAKAVLRITGQRFKTRTPYYETRVEATRVASERWKVWDNNVVYGGWLEGVSRRNQVTRFKGYKMFRLAKQEMTKREQELIRPAIQNLMRKLNG